MSNGFTLCDGANLNMCRTCKHHVDNHPAFEASMRTRLLPQVAYGSCKDWSPVYKPSTEDKL